MARLAVFASGAGSNFEAIARAIYETPRHQLCCLACDRSDAGVLGRADSMSIPKILLSYQGRNREEVEEGLINQLDDLGIDIIALAGYMRLLSPRFVDAFAGRIVNIHPALLPKYPGTHGIEESFNSDDKELGITIHVVDYGMDTGPILLQKPFVRSGRESYSDIESRIHDLEHKYYPQVVIGLLDAHDGAIEGKMP